MKRPNYNKINKSKRSAARQIQNKDKKNACMRNANNACLQRLECGCIASAEFLHTHSERIIIVCMLYVVICCRDNRKKKNQIRTTTVKLVLTYIKSF